MSNATEIARLRRELGERYDAYALHQAQQRRRLEAILACASNSAGSVKADLAEMIGRIADFRAGMNTNFAVETQALAAVEAALRGIWERAR